MTNQELEEIVDAKNQAIAAALDLMDAEKYTAAREVLSAALGEDDEDEDAA